MSPKKNCPACGAELEDLAITTCPYCNSPLLPSMSAPTMIASPKEIKEALQKSSAETMDEIKDLIREGDQEAAAEVASAEFGLSEEAAKTTVEQTATDMEHSGKEAPAAAEPEAPAQTVEPAASFSAPEEPKKPSNQRNLIIGIVAGVFLCCCCCLPIAGYAISRFINR
jgi:uncharacterized protein involved in exopolysaccharide biosynthesis